MLEDVVGMLRCPVCAGGLALAGGLRCPAGHAFDAARQGYVNLLPGKASGISGDTAEMVAARAAFLGAGHYDTIAAAVAEAAREVDSPGGVVDLGAGTGYYLAAVLDALPDRAGLAVDVSKHAVRRAARAHDRIGAAVCDTWQPLPIGDGVAGVVLTVFAPRNAPEIRRIVDRGGALVVVSPTPRHLAELVGALGLLTVAEGKQDRLDDQLAPLFTLAARTGHEFTMSLSAKDVAAVVGMGPSAWHAGAGLGQRIAALPEPVAVTASVTVSTYRPR